MMIRTLTALVALLASSPSLATPGPAAATDLAKVRQAATDEMAASLAENFDQIDPKELFASALGMLESGESPRIAALMFQLLVDRDDVDDKLRARALYNAGLAMTETRDVAETERLLTEAALTTRERRLEADARSAIGALWYRESNLPTIDEQGVETELPLSRRIELLRKSERAYRSVLDLSPRDTDAAKRVELVRREIAQLQQQQAEQEQTRQEMQDLADELEKLADEQDAEAEKTENQSESSEQRQESQQDVSDQTEQRRQESESLSNSSEDQAQKDATESAEELIQQARDKQREAQESLEAGDDEQAGQQQREAAERLRDAARKLREASEPQEQQSDDQQQQDGDQQEQQQDEAEQNEQDSEEQRRDDIAQQLLDREQLQRERRDELLRSIMGRPEAVERDW
ncbi:MAG: hypothetical protein CMJ31_04705 [Phycisphaerae bacterium]|nr:hypothetical protein [Phycisphaerae bacterium]